MEGGKMFGRYYDLSMLLANRTKTLRTPWSRRIVSSLYAALLHEQVARHRIPAVHLPPTRVVNSFLSTLLYRSVSPAEEHKDIGLFVIDYDHQTAIGSQRKTDVPALEHRRRPNDNFYSLFSTTINPSRITVSGLSTTFSNQRC